MVQLSRIEIAGEVRAAHAPTRASEGVTGVVPSSHWLLNVGSNWRAGASQPSRSEFSVYI